MELTPKQQKAIKDFFFYENPDDVMDELNEMFRRHLRDPELFCATEAETMRNVSGKHFLIDQIGKLLKGLYDDDFLKNNIS